MKLKTLKDIKKWDYGDIVKINNKDEVIAISSMVDIKELRAEAVKWVKGLKYLEKIGEEHKPSEEFIDFFNLTEKELD